MIEMRIDMRSGTPVYLQIVQQVKQALRLGMLAPGDQLPTVRELCASLAINPNTVMKAYRELEREGLVSGQPGQGTFVLETIPGASQAVLDEMRLALESWFRQAIALGLDEETIASLVSTVFRTYQQENVA